MQSASFLRMLIAWEPKDMDVNKILAAMDATAFVRDQCGMPPRCEDEEAEVMNIFTALDSDGDGHLDYEETQQFVQRVRARFFVMRREEEMTIAKAFHLSNEAVLEFRMDLPFLWEIFNRYDTAQRSVVERGDLLDFVMDIGVAPIHDDSARLAAVQGVLQTNGKDENSFPHMLHLVHEARRACKEATLDDLSAKFKTYDRDKSGELTMNEIFQILEDFQQLPRTRDEQQDISHVIERMDIDGSGTFDFYEFLEFFQRLSEQTNQHARRREVEASRALGFSNAKTAIMRRVFLQLGPDKSGKVPQLDMAHSIAQMLGTQLEHVDDARAREIMRRAQHAPEHSVDFTDFVKAIKYVCIEEPEVEASNQEHVSLTPSTGAIAGASPNKVTVGTKSFTMAGGVMPRKGSFAKAGTLSQIPSEPD